MADSPGVRDEVFKALVVAAIGAAAIYAQYAIGSHAATIEIEVKAKVAKLRQQVRDWRDAYRAFQWMMGRPYVVPEAESYLEGE